jgi:hypothetical protein
MALEDADRAGVPGPAGSGERITGAWPRRV